MPYEVFRIWALSSSFGGKQQTAVISAEVHVPINSVDMLWEHTKAGKAKNAIVFNT